jgi:hypothetical protein
MQKKHKITTESTESLHKTWICGWMQAFLTPMNDHFVDRMPLFDAENNENNNNKERLGL